MASGQLHRWLSRAVCDQCGARGISGVLFSRFLTLVAAAPPQLWESAAVFWYPNLMSRIRRSRVGRPFTIEEHLEVAAWNDRAGKGWPRLELALNYPHTPELLGVVEHAQTGVTLFVWAAEFGIVVEPFSGGSFIYVSLATALGALTRWAEARVRGERVQFGSDQIR